MKHCVIKLLMVMVIGIYSLPRLYAQDTTITIYGKNFSPRVIVKLNDVVIPESSGRIRHDTFQPSRILYVTIPLADLNTGTTTLIAGTKDAGASLNSSNVGRNKLSAANPEQLGEESISYFYVTPSSPFVLLDSSLKKLTTPFTMPRGVVGQSVSISLAIQYKNLIGDLDIRKKLRSIAADTSAFEVLDSTGNAPYAPVAVNGNGYVRFRLRCTGGNTLGMKRIFLAPTLLVAGAVKASDKYETRFFSVNEFKILVAYTDSSKNDFSMYGLKNKKDPRVLIDSCLLVINSLLDSAVVSRDSSKFANTRFVLATTPFKVTYKETSPDPHLHADIDTLEKSRTIRTCIPEIYDSLQINRISQNLKCTILLVNTKGTPYRAIGSEPLPSGRPPFVVAEIKYIDRFKQGTRDYVDSFFDLNLKAKTLSSFFFDSNLLTDLRTIINAE